MSSSVNNSSLSNRTDNIQQVVGNLSLAWVVSVYGFIVWLLVLIGNMVVLVIFCKSKRIRKSAPNWLIVSLAVSDLSGGSLNLPLMVLTLRMLETSIFTVIRPTREQMLDLFSQICHQWFMPHSSTFMCLYSIFGIAVDRFISVKYPLRNQLIVTKRKVAIYICTIWFIGITFTVLPFAVNMHLHGTMQGNITLNKTSQICGEMMQIQIIVKHILSVSLVIPVIGITMIYIYICVIAFRHKRALSRYRKDNQTGAVWVLTKALSNAKTAHVYIVIFALFLLGWVPLVIVTTLAQFCTHCNLRTLMTLTIPFGCITMLTSAINPWIYTLRTREFRRELNQLKILCCSVAKKIPKCKVKCVRLLRKDNYTVSGPRENTEMEGSRSVNESYTKTRDCVDNNTNISNTNINNTVFDTS